MLKRLLQGATAAALLSTAAFAADLPSRVAPAPYQPLPPVFTWTGFYAGTLTGYAFSDNQSIRTSGNTPGTQFGVAQGRRPSSLKSDQDGFTSIGGGIGYDYQFNPGQGLVVGIAADATLMDLQDRSAYIGPALPANGFSPEISGFRQRLDYLTTVRGRVGYGFDRLLVYGTGGFAFGNVDDRAIFLGGGNNTFAYGGRHNGIETGYVYGGGVEYAIPTESILNKFSLLSYLPLFGKGGLLQTSGITLKAEYLRYDLGSRNVAVNPVAVGAPGSFTSRFKTEGNLIRGGFTYRFGTL